MASKGKAKEVLLEDITEVPETDKESELDKESETLEETFQNRQPEVEAESTNEEDTGSEEEYDENQASIDEQGAWAIVERRRRELEAAQEAHEAIQEHIAKQNGDVSKPKHRQHPELDWKFCWADGCQAHFAKKQAERYFPTARRPL